MNVISIALVAAKVVEALAAGDDFGAVGVLAEYTPDERQEILNVAVAAGADPTQVEALRQMLGGSEIIEVEGKAPPIARRLSPFVLAGIALAGIGGGMYAQNKMRAPRGARRAR